MSWIAVGVCCIVNRVLHQKRPCDCRKPKSSVVCMEDADSSANAHWAAVRLGKMQRKWETGNSGLQSRSCVILLPPSESQVLLWRQPKQPQHRVPLCHQFHLVTQLLPSGLQASVTGTLTIEFTASKQAGTHIFPGVLIRCSTISALHKDRYLLFSH